MTHANAYGLQAGECPGGKDIYVPGEPAKDCGVDPFTGSGTTFARESGFNTYTITVKNTAPASSGPGPGDTLSCEPSTWEESPAFTYAWVRNGTVIAGAESDEYTLTVADEGEAIQCVVTGTNEGGAVNAVTPAVTVSPAPSTTVPVASTPPSATHEGAEAQTEGTALTCTPGTWSGSPSFSYRWLRNGSAIPGAESDEYTITNADLGTAGAGAALQCQVTATNAGGSVVAENTYPIVVEPGQSAYPPYPEHSPSIPVTAANETTGAVTVADRVPAGLVIEGADQFAQEEVSGEGWSCVIASGATGFTCSRSDSLGAGDAYPPIVLHVSVEESAASVVTNVAVVSGGGGALAVAYDPTTVTPAVPFGIEQLTTSVTEGIGSPFTQAGGHPIAANATLVFNRTVSNRELNNAGKGEPTLDVAGGTPKDIETELPPGFIGDPQNAPECTTVQAEHNPKECPRDSVVGFATLNGGPVPGSLEGGQQHAFPAGLHATVFVYNRVPSPGSPADLGFNFEGQSFVLTAKLRSDGDYGVTLGDSDSGRAEGKGLQAVSVTLCSYGVEGFSNEPGPHASEPATAACARPTAGTKPFLTDPTKCTGAAPVTTLIADTYENLAAYVSKTVYTGTHLVGSEASATESFPTGCDLLQFSPEVEFKPSSASEGGTTQADEPTGATFALRVPQTNEAGVNASPELKNATVTLPEGMTVDPSAADGLRACSNAQFGLGSSVEPAEPAACPLASQIGTVKVTTPLLEKPLEGPVFLGEPECSPCSASDAEDGRIFRLFLQVHSVERGVVIKLAGKVSANPSTGRLQATFTQQPELPFSELLLTLNGGARAPLANPQTCGTFTTSTDLTPWSAAGLGGLSGTEAIAGTPDAMPSSSFNVDWSGAGGACPASLPFSPSFNAGSQTPTAGASSPFSVTIGREDREQDISAITVSTPAGLLGKIAGIPQCPEAQANSGTCGPESQIGSTTVGAGPGPQPFYVGGKVYLTGPYKGQPFGLSIEVPAIAGPFNLGTVVVRASIAVNPTTAALTITSDPLPQYVDGVQLRLRKINVEVNRPGFMLNPTSCALQAVGATLTAVQGASSTVSSPFEVGACQNLPFAPGLSASARGRASKADGASLTVAVKSSAGQANIAKVDLALPEQLPSRLTTLQKACSEAQFAANPAGCPEGSDIGTARALTPILNAPLTGPAYLVSHGGAAFPDVEFVLQGEGVEIVLDGHTDIKDGVTYSKFETVPDAPVSLFETTLPEGPHSILGTDLPASANYSLCRQSLTIGTIITGQNGKQIKETTKIAVTGCTPSKPTVKITKTKLKGNTLLVTVKTSAMGRVRISGAGLKTTTKKGVAAGMHQLKVALTKAGKKAEQQRDKLKLRASLTVGKHAVATTTSVKL